MQIQVELYDGDLVITEIELSKDVIYDGDVVEGNATISVIPLGKNL